MRFSLTGHVGKICAGI
uniref:Uncharacterized protein n=1 Tax=Arundo donax TaxID=35708 RepID=A0A0A9FKF1_ARUDO